MLVFETRWPIRQLLKELVSSHPPTDDFGRVNPRFFLALWTKLSGMHSPFRFV